MDLELVDGVARRLPRVQFVMIGPVVKIDPASLPQRPNIHYLGPKPYAELPSYFGGWDVGLLPFAHNAATRFISPTKTPEYLAAGLPVVSTSITDVVRPYGVNGFAKIADTKVKVTFIDSKKTKQLVRAKIDQAAWDAGVAGLFAEVDADGDASCNDDRLTCTLDEPIGPAIEYRFKKAKGGPRLVEIRAATE
jgi:UDP-galactopyranose mutase